MDSLIKDYLDNEEGFDYIVSELKECCNLEQAECIAMKIVRDLGYRRKDPHVPNPSIEYRLTEDIYKDLDDLCQCECCKNGCQLYQEPDGIYYFQITGANFYDKEDSYAGTDTVKVYLKEFNW